MPSRLIVRPGKDKKLRKGYPWVFANQLQGVEGDPQRGDVVQVRSAEGEPFGQALYHDTSLIAGRLLTSDPDRPIDADFFRERLTDALALRAAAFPGSTHARLVYGESDGLPGTIIDRYGDVLTFSTLAYGIEQRRDLLLDLLEELVHPSAILERNDAALRRKDGLTESTGVLRGTYAGPVEIEEDGVRFVVDPLTGPKTGFFIDQRINRRLLAPLLRGRRVLDVFCADGGFGLHALAAGAASCHFVDVSQLALDRVQANAALNGLADRTTTEAVEALDWLGGPHGPAAGPRDAEPRFDAIVLDPPGFAKSHRDVDDAVKAYQRINISALKALPVGGILATASCSQAIDEAAFLEMVRYSARRAGVGLRLLVRGTQPPDHPVLDVMPETNYLSFFVFQTVRP